MTFAEKAALADATENCRTLALEVAELRRRVTELEDAATKPAPRQTLGLDRNRGRG